MKPTIRLGHIDLSFHAASAAVVKAIVERHGFDVVVSTAPHQEMFQSMGRGEVDLMASAWLPASHGAYLAAIADQVRQLTVLYRPYCIWGVPDYIPVEALDSVPQLLNPAVLARMERRVQGINPGAGISRFSIAMIQQYGLDRAGYHFEAGSEADCFGTFERAVAAEKWIVLPLWHPQYLHHRHRIRPLREPLGLLGDEDAATLLMRNDAAVKLGPALIGELQNLTIGNRVITMLDHQMRVENMAPDEAARRWLARC